MVDDYAAVIAEMRAEMARRRMTAPRMEDIGRHERLEHPPTHNPRALASMIQLRFGVPADWILKGELPSQRAGSQVTREYLDRFAPVIVLRRSA